MVDAETHYRAAVPIVMRRTQTDITSHSKSCAVNGRNVRFRIETGFKGVVVNMTTNRRREARILELSRWAHLTSLRSFWKKALLGSPIGVIRTRRWRTDITHVMSGVDS